MRHYDENGDSECGGSSDRAPVALDTGGGNMKYLNIDTAMQGRVLEGQWSSAGEKQHLCLGLWGLSPLGLWVLSPEAAERMAATEQLVAVPPVDSPERKTLNLWRLRGLDTLYDEGLGLPVGLNSRSVPTNDELREALDEAARESELMPANARDAVLRTSRAWLALPDEEVLWFKRRLHYCLTNFVVPELIEDFGADLEGEESVEDRAVEIWTQEIKRWAREVEAASQKS